MCVCVCVCVCVRVCMRAESLYGGQSGQFPWILWTKSNESMDNSSPLRVPWSYSPRTKISKSEQWTLS